MFLLRAKDWVRDMVLERIVDEIVEYIKRYDPIFEGTFRVSDTEDNKKLFQFFGEDFNFYDIRERIERGEVSWELIVYYYSYKYLVDIEVIRPYRWGHIIIEVNRYSEDIEKWWRRIYGLARLLGIALRFHSHVSSNPCSSKSFSDVKIEGKDIEDLFYENFKIVYGNIRFVKINNKRLIIKKEEESNCDGIMGPCSFDVYYIVIPIDQITLKYRYIYKNVFCGPDGGVEEKASEWKEKVITPP